MGCKKGRKTGCKKGEKNESQNGCTNGEQKGAREGDPDWGVKYQRTKRWGKTVGKNRKKNGGQTRVQNWRAKMGKYLWAETMPNTLGKSCLQCLKINPCFKPNIFEA